MPNEIREFDSLIDLLEDLDREGITGIDKRRHMENFLMRKSRLHGRPYCATFELTPLCNFDCKMCYMHLTKEQMDKEGRLLTTDEWLDIARQAVDAGVTSIDLTGGECLTYPGFNEIYLYLISRGVHVSVLTNGQLITDQHVEMFKKHKPSSVQISLYGSGPEGYMNVTGKNAFQDVMDAIRKLKTAGIHLTLTVTPNRFMQNDAESLLDLIHSLNINYSIGTATLPARPNTGRHIVDYIIDSDAYVRICEFETLYRKKLAQELKLSPTKQYFFRIKGQETFRGVPCAAGAAHFHINWKGEMTPCIGFYTVRKSVLDTKLEDAWICVRETMKQYRYPEECASCELKEGCVGCVAEKTSGVLNGNINPFVCKRRSATLFPDSIIPDVSMCK